LAKRLVPRRLYLDVLTHLITNWAQRRATDCYTKRLNTHM